MLYLCMREWREDTGLDCAWVDSVHRKIRSLLFLLREYLFSKTEKKRKIILHAMYEDFSEVNRRIDKIRKSKLKGIYASFVETTI